MKFLDSIIIKVRAGRGGDGAVSFASASCQPKLGPDGGDGGNGGNVILRPSVQLNTLSSLRWLGKYYAEDGAKGGNKNWRGKTGEDLVVPLPLGTIVYDNQTGEQLCELIDPTQDVVIAKGGRRGLGNVHWLTSTHQAPEEYRPGASGEEFELRLELKLLADVGLAGFPNAGKSTLLSVISAARPKIADYPFTTLVPNLGVVDLGSRDQYFGDSFVVADVPGLIEGASEGKGLGLEFLRHLERTSLIAYVIDGYGLEHEPLAALEVLRKELQEYSPELASKRAVVILNKIDLLDEELTAMLKADLESTGLEVIPISAAASLGLPELKARLFDLVKEEKARRGDSYARFEAPEKAPLPGSLLQAALAQHAGERPSPQ